MYYQSLEVFVLFDILFFSFFCMPPDDMGFILSPCPFLKMHISGQDSEPCALRTFAYPVQICSPRHNNTERMTIVPNNPLSQSHDRPGGSFPIDALHFTRLLLPGLRN
jgi:hypothetical protein